MKEYSFNSNTIIYSIRFYSLNLNAITCAIVNTFYGAGIYNLTKSTEKPHKNDGSYFNK